MDSRTGSKDAAGRPTSSLPPLTGAVKAKETVAGNKSPTTLKSKLKFHSLLHFHSNFTTTTIKALKLRQEGQPAFLLSPFEAD